MTDPRSGQEGHVARKLLYNRPATPMELCETDWGGDPHPPDWE